MVYCGKPSKACRECRRRNIKCDKKRDSCGQCLRARLSCPGYHDPKVPVFRDQTETVIQKSLNRKKPYVPVSIVPPFIDQAKHLFISQYVLGTSPPLDYMQTFYPGSPSEAHLSESVLAASLAYFSRTHPSPLVLQQARKKYVYALSLTNQALQSTQNAKKDTTLLTVLLLDLFEQLVREKDVRLLESETKHIYGALTIVRIRGREQFQDIIGLRMFLQLGSNVLISCLQREVEVPGELISLRAYASQFITATSLQWRAFDLTVRYAGLRGLLRTRDWTDSAILGSALDIEVDLLNLWSSLRADWPFSTSNQRNESRMVWEDNFHIYPSHKACQIWNHIRVVRILLNELVIERAKMSLCVGSSSPNNNVGYGIEGYKTCILALSSEICASVPPYIHQHSNSKYTPKEQENVRSFIYPLFIAASASICPKDMQQWILGRLEFIGSGMGIPQAIIVRQILERKERVNPWVISTMFGGMPF